MGKNYYNYKVYPDGRVYSYYRNRFLTPQVTKKGYNMVFIKTDDGTKGKVVHRLVALTFIPNTDNKPQVNHKNGIKTDNRVENLEWMTNRENVLHAIEMGLTNQSRPGETNPYSKLKEIEVRQIKIILKSKLMMQLEIAKLFDISKECINGISRGRSWKHVKI